MSGSTSAPSVEVDDTLWAAVGEPTRRRLLDLLLAGGPATATGLAAHLPLTRQAVAKHLAVLERAGLVTAEPHGREVRFGVDEQQVARAAAAMAAVAGAWDARLARIRRIAEAVQRERDALG